MSKKSLKKNYVYNMCYQILIIITPIITAPYLSRVLNPDGVGMISFMESILSYFTLFATLGITTYGQREISYVQNDIKKRSEVFYNTFLMKFFISLIVILIYLISIFAFTSYNNNYGTFQMYLVMVFGLLSVTFDITWFFQGLEEFGTIVLRNTIFRIIQVVLTFILIKNKNDIILYLFLTNFLMFLSNLSLWLKIKKYIEHVDLKILKPFKDVSIAISLFFPSVAIQIYTVLDKTMIGIITNNIFENGYYEQAIKMPRIMVALVTAISAVIMPRISFAYKNNDIELLNKLLYKSYRFVLFLSIPITFGLFMVSSNFVPWFFGRDFVKVADLLKILSFLVIIISLSNITGIEYMVSTNKQKLLTISVCAGAVINFILNLILIKNYLSIGASIASVVAEIFITVIQFYLVRKDVDVLIILKQGAKYIISAVIMVVVLNIFTHDFVSCVKNTMIIVVIGVLTYFCSLLIMKDEFLYENINVIYNKIKKTIA